RPPGAGAFPPLGGAAAGTALFPGPAPGSEPAPGPGAHRLPGPERHGVRGSSLHRLRRPAPGLFHPGGRRPDLPVAGGSGAPGEPLPGRPFSGRYGLVQIRRPAPGRHGDPGRGPDPGLAASPWDLAPPLQPEPPPGWAGPGLSALAPLYQPATSWTRRRPYSEFLSATVGPGLRLPDGGPDPALLLRLPLAGGAPGGHRRGPAPLDYPCPLPGPLPGGQPPGHPPGLRRGPYFRGGVPQLRPRLPGPAAAAPHPQRRPAAGPGTEIFEGSAGDQRSPALPSNSPPNPR